VRINAAKAGEIRWGIMIARLHVELALASAVAKLPMDRVFRISIASMPGTTLSLRAYAHAMQKATAHFDARVAAAAQMTQPTRRGYHD
jgi:hypothetical protein